MNILTYIIYYLIDQAAIKFQSSSTFNIIYLLVGSGVESPTEGGLCRRVSENYKLLLLLHFNGRYGTLLIRKSESKS